jgi:hypothetical protein
VGPTVDHFDRLDFLLLLLLPALLRAIATACFCGLPALISVLMFELIVFRDEPFLSGMESILSFEITSARLFEEAHEGALDAT